MAPVPRRHVRRAVTIVSLLLVFYICVRFLCDDDNANIVASSTFIPSSLDWSTVPQSHALRPSDLAALPAGKPRKLPKVQFPFRVDTSPKGRARKTIVHERREEVKSAFVKSWKSYKERAWMFDELAPLSGTGKNTFGGWAATLVDSLDALWILDLKDDFYEAVRAVAVLDWSATEETACNFFETTIRHLGGLLSAYDLSGETVLLLKAVELGDMLYMAFDTPNRMPPFWLDFEKAQKGQLEAGDHDPSASVASSSLEFTRLAQLTGNPKYYDAIDRITRLLEETQNSTRLPGMWPTFFDLRNLILDDGEMFTLGALADSLYELLPKMHALLGGLEFVYEKLYINAMETVKAHMLFRPMLPGQDDILFTGNVYVRGSIELQPEGQHLSCFVGGMFALGGKLLNRPDHVDIGARITKGCVWMYEAMPSGIMPEIFDLFNCPTLAPCDWDQDLWEEKGDLSLKKGIRDARDPRYLLRPEAIESVFIMYRVTGLEEYQDMAWNMFQSIRKATETDLAFSAISNVTVKGDETEKVDSMEVSARPLNAN
ncbi:glycoside hydrolase family 47 protein [Xylariaceae sp. FL1272]|nr:glycoside hydrolase family 47 protein [Xylariaceae sp. FL1272]